MGGHKNRRCAYVYCVPSWRPSGTTRSITASTDSVDAGDTRSGPPRASSWRAPPSTGLCAVCNLVSAKRLVSACCGDVMRLRAPTAIHTTAVALTIGAVSHHNRSTCGHTRRRTGMAVRFQHTMRIEGCREYCNLLMTVLILTTTIDRRRVGYAR